MRLNPNVTTEPFPINVQVRSEQHKQCILAAAEKAGVMESAQRAESSD